MNPNAIKDSWGRKNRKTSTSSNNVQPDDHTSLLAEAIKEVCARKAKANPDPFQRYPDPVPQVIHELFARKAKASSISGQHSNASCTGLLAEAIYSVLAQKGRVIDTSQNGKATSISQIAKDIDNVLAQKGAGSSQAGQHSDPRAHLLATVIKEVFGLRKNL